MAKAKKKTCVGSKGGGLDVDLVWATNLLAGGQFDTYVESEGGSARENYIGKEKSEFEAEHHSPTN